MSDINIHNKLIIKEVVPSLDAQAFKDIVKMDQICFPDDDVFIPQTEYSWIAYSKDRPVGYCILKKISNQKNRKTRTAHMSRAGVIPKFRGQGLQRKFITLRIEKAKQLGYTRVTSTTYDNPHSTNNLIKCGFLCYDPEDRYLADGTNYWELDIASVN